MDKTIYKVYWTAADGEAKFIDFHTLDYALRGAASLRAQGFKFITMVCENIDHVGKSGVDEVKDGKTPDGEDYTWSKEHRAGATRGTAYSIIDNKSNG
jgi:hypothetical protein